MSEDCLVKYLLRQNFELLGLQWISHAAPMSAHPYWIEESCDCATSLRCHGGLGYPMGYVAFCRPAMELGVLVGHTPFVLAHVLALALALVQSE